MVNQYRAFWSIPNAGPSVSTFHAQASSGTTAQALADNVQAFFNALTNLIPNEVSLSFDTEVIEIDTATGLLTGTLPVTAPVALTGSGSGTWAAGSGARVVWGTSDIVAGRRVRGATFIVPMTSAAFNSSGQVTATAITQLADAGNAFIAAGDADTAELLVYSRPVPGRPGSTSAVETASVPPTAATLRGRKY